LAGSVVVGKIVVMQADVVGFRVVEEAHSVDVGEAVDEGFAHPVHAIHDTAVAGKNDRKAEVAVADEAGVLSDLSAGDRLSCVAGPVGFVEFADSGERYTLPWQAG
jgi:hypothetical protein